MLGEIEFLGDLWFKCVLLKIFGEVLMGLSEYGIYMLICIGFVEEIVVVCEFGVEICLVIGGGNIFCGMKGVVQGMECLQVDFMGMLVIIMNVLVMQSVFELIGVQMCVQFGIWMDEVCEFFICCCVIWYMEKG